MGKHEQKYCCLLFQSTWRSLKQSFSKRSTFKDTAVYCQNKGKDKKRNCLNFKIRMNLNFYSSCLYEYTWILFFFIHRHDSTAPVLPQKWWKQNPLHVQLHCWKHMLCSQAVSFPTFAILSQLKISSYYFNSLSNNSKRLPFAVYIGKLFLPKIIFTLSSICGQRPYWANITYSKLSHIWELILDTVSFFKQKGMLSKSHSEVSPQLSSSDIY